MGHMRVFGCKAHVRTAKAHLTKLEDRSVPMVYFGVEERSKAHRLYNPQTRRIVVSRDVVFKENVAWRWNTEFGENLEFRVEENGEGVAQQGYAGVFGGYGGENHNAQPQEASGGVPEQVIQKNSGGIPEHMLEDSGGINHELNQYDEVVGSGENSMQQGSDVQIEHVDSQVTKGENSVNHELDGDQMLNDENMDVDHDDAPIRMRSIYEVYEDAAEVEVTSDVDIEVNALLTVMEEPTCYQEAANSVDWRAAMESEL